ncbi:hypothetical protein MEO43_28960, partial [Dolichospermum sp. ST_sed5]|nr:hypothetical protein [Dolichospermum sp. ST_sed5]
MSGIPIYQFCRGFDNVRYSEVYKCYVSGGYAFDKITRWNHEVPPEIREAVIDDYFKLNDNYPPDQDNFALIAREINDKYSVLAVANRQLDDGDRPTIGYQYFWLEKSSPDVDGIGTLIYWWRDNQFQFNMAELVETSPPQMLYSQGEEEKINFYLQATWLEDTRKTVNNLKEIPKTSVVTKDDWQGLPPYIKLHYLALGLSLRANHTNSPNAWAWNVQKIAHPDSFISIFYATQEDIPSNTRKRNLPPLAKNPTPDKAQTENPTPLSSKTSNSIPPAVEKNIKSCLSSLANTFNQNGLDAKKTQELFEYLRDYADADWTNCIDKTRVTASSPYDIYPQLIYLVAPNNKLSENWLLKMVQSLEIDTKKTSPRILEFQRVLLEASFEYEDPLVNQRLISSIYTGISYLLNQLMSTEKGNNKIEFLLTQSQNVWSYYFLTYAELIKKRIFSEEKTIIEESMENFCQEILTLLQESKNITLEKRKQYKKLASTFIKINYYSLAGTFYYIGDKYGNIPPNIRDSIDPKILRKIYYDIKSQKTDSHSKNNHEPKDNEIQDNKHKEDESRSNEPQNNEPKENEARSKKPKDNPIPDNPSPYQPTQYNPIQHNPIQNEDNRQAFILFVIFLAGSILLKLWKSFILTPQILLLFVSIIYFILSVIVIHLTIDNFFNRRSHRFKQSNRIIGSSLAIFYICVFVSIVWEIDGIPKFINLFGENDQTQLAGQDIRKSQNQNNVPGTNRNTSPNPNSSPSNNINCPEDALTNFQAFKDCTKNESDKSKLEEELKTQYVLSSPDNQITGNLIKYYLNSENEQEF